MGIEDVYGAPKGCEDARVNERVAWVGRVRVLEEFGPVDLDGIELGRTSLVARGSWCVPAGRAVTIELELKGKTVQFLTTVAASAYVGSTVVLRLDIEASSPRGNDLLAAAVRGGWDDVETCPDNAAFLAAVA